MLELLRERPYQILFFALASTFFIMPVLPTGLTGGVLLVLLTTIILLAAVNSVTGVRWGFFFGLALAITALATAWAGLAIANRDLSGISATLMAVFLALTGWAVLTRVLRAPRVTTEVLYGGVAVYLLLGVLWALAFSALLAWAPGSLAFPDLRDGTLADPRGFAVVMYYSFVTITTLGYGDVLPTTDAARSLAIALAVFGQLYLIVLIARLVALHISHGQTTDS